MKYAKRLCVCLILSEVAALWFVDRMRDHDSNDLPFLAPVVDTLSATPSSIVFTSTSPDTPASASGSVFTRVLLPVLGKQWELTVHASSPTLTNCSIVPVSAIRASCTSTQTTGGLLFGPSGTCRSSFALSTSPTVLASGTQGDGGVILFPDNYTVLMTYTFTDAWNYPGANSPSCGVTLIYTLNVSY